MIRTKENMVTLITESFTHLRIYQLATCDGEMTYAHCRP